MFESLRLFNSDMDPHWLYCVKLQYRFISHVKFSLISLPPTNSSLILPNQLSSTALLAAFFPSHHPWPLPLLSTLFLICSLLSSTFFTLFLPSFLRISTIFLLIMVSNITSTPLALLFLLMPAALIPSISNRQRLSLPN